jgi:peptide/nickel transport system ATP-binding protein
MSETLLELKDLSVRYTTDGIISRAVNHVNLKLNKGEVLGLVGETGAGKTTTALSLLSLLPKYTSEVEGEILFQGKDLLKLDEKEIRKIRGRHISMIFQDPMTSLNPVFRIGEQIADVIRIQSRQHSQHGRYPHIQKEGVPSPVLRRHETKGYDRDRDSLQPGSADRR